MNLVKVRLKNFLSHVDTALSLQSGLTGFIGAVGSGKSSLISDSVTWCLWGVSRSGGAGDDLIHDDKDMCEVEITFESNQDYFKATRTRKRDKKTTLVLLREEHDMWVDMSGMTLKDTQAIINSVLGMSYEVFKNSCCIVQGDTDSFSKLSPSAAASTMLEILQLTNYKKYKTVATDKYMIVRSEIDRLKLKQQTLTDDLSTITNQSKVIIEKTERLKSLQGNLDKITEQYKKVEGQVQALEAKRRHLMDKAIELKMLVSATEDCLKEETEDEIKLQSSSEQCSLCAQHLTDEARMEAVARTRAGIDKLNSDLAEFKEALVDAESKLRSTNTEIFNHGLTNRAVEFKKASDSVIAAKAELETLVNTQTDATKIRQELEGIKTELEKLSKSEEVFSELSTAFSSKGIPLLIIDNLIGELGALINANLGLLADSSIRVELSTLRESTSGDLLDTFEINVVSGIYKRPYFNYSGGQKLLVDLAIRLALSELLARRNNFKVETLIIDEGLGSLDESAQINFFKTLNKLTARFDKILVITHTQIKDYFNQVVRLELDGKITKVDSNEKPCYTINSEEKI